MAEHGQEFVFCSKGVSESLVLTPKLFLSEPHRLLSLCVFFDFSLERQRALLESGYLALSQSNALLRAEALGGDDMGVRAADPLEVFTLAAHPKVAHRIRAQE